MRIGELAALTGVSVRSLRYYEHQGLLDPKRSLAGHRLYTVEDQALVEQIQELFQAGFCSSVIQDLLPSLNAQSTLPRSLVQDPCPNQPIPRSKRSTHECRVPLAGRSPSSKNSKR